MEGEKRKDQARSTTERIERELLDSLLGGNRETADLLALVTGKNSTKYEVLERLQERGRVIATRDGKRVIYSLAEIPIELEKEAA